MVVGLNPVSVTWKVFCFFFSGIYQLFSVFYGQLPRNPLSNKAIIWSLNCLRYRNLNNGRNKSTLSTSNKQLLILLSIYLSIYLFTYQYKLLYVYYMYKYACVFWNVSFNFSYHISQLSPKLQARELHQSLLQWGHE